MDALRLMVTSGGNSAAAMLLSLNFILLSFFITLVAMATSHTSKKELALAGVAAEFRAHDEATPQPAGAFLPHAGASAWQPQLSGQVVGMVASLLAVNTPEMEADANRLIVHLPLSAVMKGDGLGEGAQKALPNLLQLAAAADTSAEVWLAVANADAATTVKYLKALSPVAAGVPLGLKVGDSGAAELQIIYRPLGGKTTSQGGATLNRLPGEAAGMGGEIHGQE